MSDDDDLAALEGMVSARARKIFADAKTFSTEKLAKCSETIGGYLEKEGLAASELCFVAVGSVGRYEALSCSDLDLIPVLGNLSEDEFKPHDRPIRDAVSASLGVKVSQGDELTRFQRLEELTAPESIGGDKDSNTSLTKRVLILSEGAQAGGGLKLSDVRRPILETYAREERTRGRHLLTLNNDIARYYRTLCIEYKAKVDVGQKTWCTRNLKLRHSRKFWYFSTMLALADHAKKGVETGDALLSRVLDTIGQPPWERLLAGLGTNTHVAGRVLEPYAWFLDFMSKPQNREALDAVTYEKRYDAEVKNPFPAMKANSDLMHREMVSLLDVVDRPTRDRVLDWFLL